jgi:hypothetical protein
VTEKINGEKELNTNICRKIFTKKKTVGGKKLGGKKSFPS